MTAECSTGAPRPPVTSMVPALILARARVTPDAVALVQWDRSLTYRELVTAAGALAATLREHGVGPETRVGICCDRTLDLPVAVLAVRLAGGAYVPLDPSHPVHRLTTVADDAGITLVVADETGAALLRTGGRTLLRPAAAHPGAPIPATPPLHPDNAAYVLYTSGSTGRPKGVVVSNRSEAAFAAAVAACRPTGPASRSAGFAALSFDTSLFDLVLPLTTGASVALLPTADRTDPVALQRFLVEHRVTRAMLPPAVLPLLDPAALPALTELFVAGEPCGPEQVARWCGGGRRFHNWYGPTETTVIVTGAEYRGDWTEPLPIGHPLPGCTAHVLDERRRPCPPGEPGELCIGGPQLARGYLGRPGHTADRFVPDPFGAPGARLYRTGDLVAWRPDGHLAFLGRLDRQVKINGQRVEIGELETVLLRHSGVRHAVVDVVPDGPRLDVYLTPADGPELAELREFCARYLPSYMLPGRVVRRDVLALTVSGKVDLDALRAANETTETVVPQGSATVATVWAEVFGGPVPAPDTSFAAAGGHSLLAMRLVSALRARLGRQVTVADVHEARTVAGLTRRVEQAPPVAGSLPTGSPAALSPMQRRMWFVEQLNPGVPAHNISLAEELTGPLDVAALRTALRSVAARQETLRWRVPARHGVPTVEVLADVEVPLPVHEVPASEVPAWLDAEAGVAFDLATGPLWRAALLRLGPDRHVLALTVHHLVFDGWSADVLDRDLAEAYRTALTGRPAGADLSATFADYVAWTADRHQRHGRAALDWWAAHLADVPSVLDLPRDRPRPAVQTFRGAQALDRVPSDVAAAVRELAVAHDATAFAVLLAAFGQLLTRLTGQSEMIVGTPLVDRGHQAFERLVGCCLNVLPLRLRVDAGDAFAAQVAACRDELADAMAHQDLPLDQLVEVLSPRRDLSRNPLVQVLFNMYTFAEAQLVLPGVSAVPLTAGLPGALYDLTLYVSEHDGGYDLRAVYNPDLYDAARIEALLAGYRVLLERLVASPDAPGGQAGLRRGTDPLPDPCDALPRATAEPVHARFERHVVAHGERVAVTGAGGTLSYAQAGELYRQTVAAVRAAGVPEGAPVAVLAARDVRLPAVLLGVLASGARWVVVDPDAPAAVRAAQLAATSARAAIVLGGDAPDGLPVLTVDPERPDGPVAPASQRGYYSLTSGSTGLPRPVCVTDRPLAHFLDWYPRTFELGEDDRFALLAGLAHDPLLRDAFAPLVLGGTLHVPDPELLREPPRLRSWLAAERITVLHLTPQLARLLAADGAALPDVRLVLLGGDQLLDTDLAPLRALAPHARLVNGYGATETPQVQAYHEITGALPQRAGGQPVPVGHGAQGIQLLVLTADNRAAGVGELGEVVVRGEHLASGYADAAQDTGRFGTGGLAAGPWYRTGDLGRYRQNGAVELSGRVDDQVKIRGFRVELGAVEAALTEHPDISAACVLAVAENGERGLRGFAVPARAGVRSWQVLEHLRTRLPSYAVPGDLVLLARIPLTRNGKVDREALRATARGGAEPGRADELTGHTQKVIAGVWREVLGLPRLGASDNFFEVGGNSMAIVVVRDRLTELLGRPIPLVDLFRHPTIRALTAHLEGAGRDSQVERAVQRAAVRRTRTRQRAIAIATRTRSAE